MLPRLRLDMEDDRLRLEEMALRAPG